MIPPNPPPELRQDDWCELMLVTDYNQGSVQGIRARYQTCGPYGVTVLLGVNPHFIPWVALVWIKWEEQSR